MKFRVRAQWYGPGQQTGVESGDIEADSACDVLDEALPGEWLVGEFTSAKIDITQVSGTARTHEEAREKADA